MLNEFSYKGTVKLTICDHNNSDRVFYVFNKGESTLFKFIAATLAGWFDENDKPSCMDIGYDTGSQFNSILSSYIATTSAFSMNSDGQWATRITGALKQSTIVDNTQQNLSVKLCSQKKEVLATIDLDSASVTALNALLAGQEMIIEWTMLVTNKE